MLWLIKALALRESAWSAGRAGFLHRASNSEREEAPRNLSNGCSLETCDSPHASDRLKTSSRSDLAFLNEAPDHAPIGSEHDFLRTVMANRSSA